VRQYIEDACEEIDAAFFTGDAFLDEQHRKDITEYIERWQRELKRLDIWVNSEEYKKEIADELKDSD
jgi:ADP-dependent phosphofructokinase/glucokinase